MITSLIIHRADILICVQYLTRADQKGKKIMKGKEAIMTGPMGIVVARKQKRKHCKSLIIWVEPISGLWNNSPK
jgi:5S rRNA maturation endonuclease (ribonuclease M5)